MPLDYRHVSDMYNQLAEAGAVSEPLSDWSNRMNQATGTNDYSAGVDDNWLKRASVGIDKLLEATGIPSVTGAIGRGAGELLGIPEAGEQIGKSLPRDIVDIAPWALSAFGPPGVAAGAALSSGLSGAKAYTDTGSVASGVTAGALNLAIPGVGGLARNVALKKLGAELLEGRVLPGAANLGVDELQQLARTTTPRVVGEYVPTTFGQAAGGFAAEQAAQTGVGLVGNAAQSLYSGEPFHWDPREELLGAIGGNIPFAGLSVARHGLAGFGGEAARRHIEETKTSMALTEQALDQKRLADIAAEQTQVENIPEVLDTSPEFADRNTKINELRNKQRMASVDGTTFSEEDRQKFMDEEDGLVKAQGQQKGNVFGARIDENTPRRVVYGTEVVNDPDTGFRRVQVSDDPRNGDLAGRQIGYNTIHEPANAEGEFSVPVGYHSEFMPTGEGRFDPEAKLNTAQQKLAAAKSNIDLHDAVLELNGVRKSYGLTPVDDVNLTRRQQDFELGSIRDAVQSEIERTRGISKAKDVGQELVRIKTEGRRVLDELNTAKTAGDAAAEAAAQAKLNELNDRFKEVHPNKGEPLDKDRAVDIANAPMDRNNAPAKDWMNERAVAITEGTDFTDSQAKFLTWAQNGRTGLKVKYGMTLEDMGKFMQQPEVAAWRKELEGTMAGGMKLDDYSNRYLKNIGLSEEQAAAHTKRVMDLADKGDFVAEHLLKSEPVDPEVRKSAGEMNNALAANPETKTQVDSLLGELGHGSVDELYNEMVRTGKLDEDALHMLPPEVANYISAKARDHEHAMNVLDSASEKKTQGDAFVPENTKDAAGETLSSIGKVLEVDKKRGDYAAALSGADTIVPQNWMQRTIRGLIDDPMQLLGDTIKGSKDFLKTLNFITASSPETAEYGVRSHQLNPNIKKMYTEGLKMFAMDKNNEGPTQQYMKALKDPSTVAALDKWIGLNMRRGQEAGSIKMLSPDDIGVQRILRGLPDEKKQNVIDLMNKVVHSVAMNNAQRLEKMEGIAVVQGAEMLNDVMGAKAKYNEQLSEAVMRGIKNPADAVAQQMSKIALEKIAARDMDAAAKLVDHMNGAYEKMQEQSMRDAKNPALVSSNMYGKWDVTYKKGGKEYFTRVDSKAAAQGLGGEILDIRRNETDGDTQVDYSPKGLREDAKWFENHISATKKDAAYWSRALYKAQTEFLLGSVELKDRPDLQRFIQEHHANMLAPDYEMARQITKFTSGWFLGGNVASAMINGTQMFTRGAAELTRLTGNPLSSWKSVMSSLKEIGEARLGKQWRSPDHEWLVKRWEGERDASSYDVGVERPINDDVSLQLKKMLFTGRPQSVTEHAGGLLNNFNKVGMYLFRSIEDVNTMSAMLSGFDHFRKQKLPDGTYMTREEAYRKAAEFNQNVNDVGGKANRPIMAYSKMPKSAAMIATALQSYNIGSVGQMVRLMKQSWPGSKGMTPADRYNARMATAQLMGVQLGLAGMMGMPFVGGGLAVINQLFPQLEINKNLRTLTQQLFGEDEGHDNVLSDAAMNGLPSMLGWDFQSRLSMGNTLPGVSEINGYQPDIMAGPSYRIISDFVGGGKKALGGDFMGGMKDMTPPALKKVWEAIQGDGKVRTYDGRPVAGGDRTWGELTGQVIGFQPTRLTEANKMNRIIKQSKGEQKKRDSQFNQELGQGIVDGKFGDVIQKLKDRQAQEPEYDIRAGGRKAADAALNLQFPRDLRKELNRTDTQIAKLLPVYHDVPTEQQKHTARNMILRRLGVPTNKTNELYYATLSQVEAENPEWTKYDMQHEAQRRLNKLKKQDLLEVDESALNF